MFGFGKGGKDKGSSGETPVSPPPPPAPAAPVFSGSVGNPTPDEALALLKAGNLAFVRGEGVLAGLTRTIMRRPSSASSPSAQSPPMTPRERLGRNDALANADATPLPP